MINAVSGSQVHAVGQSEFVAQVVGNGGDLHVEMV